MAGDLAEQAATHPALVSQGGHPLWRTNITICLVEAERYEVAEHILSARHPARRAQRLTAVVGPGACGCVAWPGTAAATCGRPR